MYLLMKSYPGTAQLVTPFLHRRLYYGLNFVVKCVMAIEVQCISYYMSLGSVSFERIISKDLFKVMYFRNNPKGI